MQEYNPADFFSEKIQTEIAEGKISVKFKDKSIEGRNDIAFNLQV